MRARPLSVTVAAILLVLFSLLNLVSPCCWRRWGYKRLLFTCQYTSVEFSSRLREEGLLPSMGSLADAYDNSMAES